MTDTLYLARAEAIKRGGQIGIQKILKTTLAANWQIPMKNGVWLVYFEDSNSDGKWQSTETKSKTIITPANTNVIHKSGGASIKVDRYGMMSGPRNAKGFIFAPEPAGISSPATQGICMSSGGRIRVIKEVPCS